jgi:hypothetical protein
MNGKPRYSLNKVLSRRTILRGAGVGLALPLLDAMVPSVAWSAPVAKRLFGFYVPNGAYELPDLTGRPYGFWKPGADPVNQFPLALMQLKPHWADMLIVSGMNNSSYIRSATNYPGGGTAPNMHRTQVTSFMTGSPPIRDAAGKYLDMKVGTASIDQVLAKASAATGKCFHVNLTSTTTAEGTDNTLVNNRYAWLICFREDGRPVDALSNQNDVLQNFFLGVAGGTPTSGVSVDALKKVYDKSHLDFMRDSIGTFKASLGNTDRRLFNDYLEELRTLEVTANELAVGPPPITECVAPETIGDPTRRPVADLVAGPQFVDYSRFAMRAAVFGVKCGLVNGGGFSFGVEPSNIIYKNAIPASLIYPGASLTGRFHSDGIHGKNSKMLASIHNLHFSLVAEMVASLKATKVNNVPLLDSTVLMLGTGFGQGDKHLPGGVTRAFVGGKAFGLGGGRHIDAAGKEVSTLYLGLLKQMGAEQPSFGYAGGKTTTAMPLI